MNDVQARDHMAANLRHWDEAAALHPHTAFYHFYLDRLRAGGTSLHRLEIEEVGDVEGRTMLHLQCHIGTESSSWARRGARVTAVDFSANAVAEATRLSAELGVDVRYVQANIYELAGVLDEEFDIVYTSWGVLGWLPDLQEWARVVARHLRPGGVFYIAEFHPFLWVFDETAQDLRLRYGYFDPEPIADDSPDTYADPGARLENTRTYGWQFPLGTVVSSLIDAGLEIEFLHELPRCVAQVLPMLVRDEGDDERWFRMPAGTPDLPLAFTLRAHRSG